MHTRGRPQEWRTLPAVAPAEVVPLVLRDLKARAESALAAGIQPDQIVLDPGFGFGKRLDENYPLLAALGELRTLGYPVLAGLSRKSFLTQITRSEDSITAANTAAILAGAHILRVHDVPPARQAAAVADRILAARAAGYSSP